MALKERPTKKKIRRAMFANKNDANHYKYWIDKLPLLPIENEQTNLLALEILGDLGELIEEEKATQAEIGYFKVLARLVKDFETNQYGETKKLTPIELLKLLMESNNLKQEDLAKEFGSQGRVSDFLNEKRELSLKQIKNLSTRFKIDPSTFL